MSRVLLKNDVTLCREDGSKVTFHIEKKIGSGASCVVYQAICDDKTEHLLKEYYPRNLELERNGDGTIVVPSHKQENFDAGLLRFREGAERQKKVRLLERSKNSTVNVQGYFYGNGTEYIDMTDFSGCIYNEVQKETLHSLMLRMRDLAQAIGNYHDAAFLHLDIKPENIFVLDEDQPVKGIMLFDFDSLIAFRKEKGKYVLEKNIPLSYTKDWAAPEQLLPYKRNSICEATDLFSIGEIIFTKIFERHSTQAERRTFVNYDIDYKADIFKNVNPKVVPLIKELFRHTLCAVPSRRYQTANELIAQLDKIIKLSNPEKQFLISSTINPQDGFIGRDAEMQDIHKNLQQNPILFLHGIGGIGKSELAKQYAKRYMSEYDTVIFAPYTTDMVSLIANDSHIQINNFSRATNETVEEYYEQKLQMLKELVLGNGERTLLVVDNLNTTEDKNIKILFELGCRVLITSRNDLGTVFQRPQIEIEAFRNRSYSRELFRQYNKFSDDESTDVDAIIDFVQGHTLAIELIAKQIDAEWSTVQNIRKKLESDGIFAIGDEEIDNTKDDSCTPNSAFGHIKSLFNLSVFEKDNNDNELYVLANLSLIPFTGIDRNCFADWCDLGNHGGKSCVNRLIKSGWIRLEGKCVSLHPLVSEVVINYAQLRPDMWEPYLTNLKDALFSWVDFPTDQKRKIEELAYTVFALFRRLPVAIELIAVILKDIGTFFAQCLYKYDIAILAMETANGKRLACCDNNLEFEAAIYNDIGVIYDNLGQIKEDPELIRIAIKMFEKCLKLYERFNAEIINIVKTYQSLACAYDNIGKYDIAESTFNKAIGIINNKMNSEGKTCEDTEELTRIYCNLAFHYKKLNSLDEAFDNLKTALAYASLVNMNSEQVAKIYHDMALNILCNEAGNIDEAERFARQSLKIRSDLFPSESYYLAMSKYALARALIKKGCSAGLEEAKTLLTVIKPIYIQVLGEKNTDVKKLSWLLDSLS